MATFSENDSPIMCLQFNPVDKAIASGSDDGRIKYWDLDKFNRVFENNI
jgi:katanin p80 WD40 repeat-containing subunit B1